MRRRQETAYRGHDRRGVVAADRRSPGKLFGLAGLVLLALVIVPLAVGPLVTTGHGPALAVATAQLTAGTFAAALVVTTLCFVCWRLVGEAPLLWLGVATATYGLFTLDLGYIEALSLATGNEAILLLRPAGQLVALALAIQALLSPEVDATLRPTKVVLSVVVAVAILTVGLQLLPGAAQMLPTSGTDVLGGPAMPSAAAAIGPIWLLAGIWALWLGLRGRHVLAWFGLAFLGIGFAGIVALVPVSEGSLWAAGPALLRLFGFLCAVVGATAEFAHAYVRQGGKLLESVTSERTAEARFQAERATQAERAHEARNALAAIEGATRTLQRYQDQIDEHGREELAEAVSAEVHRLQQLVSGDASSRSPGRFRLTEALAAVVTSARWQGLSVTMDVPEHLVAVGQPADTAQVLQNLFQNASRYAGGAIAIHASLEGDEVAIHVADDGPGIPLEERESIFSRGFRGTNGDSVEGNGLGLYIAARLMHQQGGDLRVEDSESGGACFVVSLPGFSELGADGTAVEQALDEVDEGAELAVVRQHSVLAFPPHRKRAAIGIEDEDGVRDDVAR